MTTFLLIAGWPNADAATTAGTRELLKSTPSWFLNNAGSDTIRGIEPANDENVVDQKFWFAMTAFLLVEACGNLDGLRRLFERPVAQYCGRISYAMYLVHGPALDYFQDMVLGRPAVIPTKEDKFLSPRPGSGIKGLIGVETATQRTLTWFLGLLVLGFIIVWIADLFWRFVDAPIVKLGRLQHQIEEEVELSVVVY
ncbi:hypothetical protein SEUCBS140593_009714 [Sporothrix eucalyptigena]|uniref:Acyltransferase 3 domain-containing protein n=1 Tax=Sporothrix eucalyptigena TaxID=1812306 RepID=A0ABP0D0R8_9PEZI